MPAKYTACSQHGQILSEKIALKKEGVKKFEIVFQKEDIAKEVRCLICTFIHLPNLD